MALTVGGGFLVSGEVSAARAHLQLFVAGRVGHHPYSAVATVRSRIAWLVGNAVLVPDITRHGLAHFVDFLEILGGERHSPALQRKGLEGAFESLGIAFFAEAADALAGRPMLVLTGPTCCVAGVA